MDNRDLENIEKLVEEKYGRESGADGAIARKFYREHVLPVTELADKLALKYGADRQIVRLGALLHDIALAEGKEPHDEVGAQMAYEMLVVNWTDRETAEKVRDIVAAHRCKVRVPESLEAKVVATADAIAHFYPEFYRSSAKLSREDWAQMMSAKIDVLESEYERKVFFEDEKKMLKERLKKFGAYMYAS